MLLTSRKHDIWIILSIALMTSYWVVDLVGDVYGARFGIVRLMIDLSFVLAQIVILRLIWRVLRQRRALEETLLTERRQVEEEKNRTEAILASLSDCISIQDRHFRVLYQNASHKRLSRGDHLGELCYEAFARGTEVCDGCPVAKTFSDGLSHWQEKSLQQPGSERQIEIVTSPLLDREGQVVAVIEMIRDVSHRKVAEEEIRQLNRQLLMNTAELKAANLELEAFNSSLSHDLRSPLSQINTAIDLLEHNLETGDAVNEHNPFFIRTIRDGSERIDQMIQGMLELSRTSRSDMTRATVDLGAMATDIVRELRQRDSGRQVQVQIGTGLTASADPVLLRIVLQNLIENAWKFTARTPEPIIEVGRHYEEDGREVFYVRDNGAGFNPQQVGRLFFPFQRLHDDRDFPGNGIGLSTVQRIVQRHGGMIWARGERGKGAAFFFTLEPGSE